MILVKEYANEGFVDRNDNFIWSLIWTKFFNTLDEALAYMWYKKAEFGHRFAYYKRNGDRWELIEDNRY